VAIRSTATAKSNTGGPITATPSGVQVGDYLAGFYVADGPSSTYSPPPDWTEQLSANNGPSSPDGHTHRFSDKVAAGGDSFQFDDNGDGVPNILTTAALSGRNTGAAITDMQATVNTSFNGTGNPSTFTATFTGVTAALGDDVLWSAVADQGASGDQWSFSNHTAGYTERHDERTTTWNASMLATRENVSAGATGSLQCLYSEDGGSSSQAGYSGIVVAIAKAAAPARRWIFGGR
jgi:hypothetical protein